MSHLTDKKILLGVTGSIAAYKSAELLRLLKGVGADIKVVMTEDAKAFISPLTLQALSGQPVHHQLLDHDSEAAMSHIALAKWADLLLVAPATANSIAKFAAGLADDLLSALYLASDAPVVMVPAMNQQMWQHPATVSNMVSLQGRGVRFAGPDFGQQACGDIGYGRMQAPAEVITALESWFVPKLLMGVKLLITAGPTREPIDPVRYISNYSSGKMGYALAEAALALGGQVTLITGPTQLPVPNRANVVRVQTAEEMYTAVFDHVHHCDLLIAAAAVADYRLTEIAARKIKKPAVPKLELVKNKDILKAVSEMPDRPFLVGFAAETHNILTNARTKLVEKKLDMIIANHVNGGHLGFEQDENAVTVLTKGVHQDFPLCHKRQLADMLLPVIFEAYEKRVAAVD